MFQWAIRAILEVNKSTFISIISIIQFGITIHWKNAQFSFILWKILQFAEIILYISVPQPGDTGSLLWNSSVHIVLQSYVNTNPTPPVVYVFYRAHVLNTTCVLEFLLTCVSVSIRLVATSNLFGLERYLFCLNCFSSSRSCWDVKAVLGRRVFPNSACPGPQPGNENPVLKIHFFFICPVVIYFPNEPPSPLDIPHWPWQPMWPKGLNVYSIFIAGRRVCALPLGNTPDWCIVMLI